MSRIEGYKKLIKIFGNLANKKKIIGETKRKTKDIKSVRENETFSTLEIDIRVSLATRIDLIDEAIKESRKEK